MSHEAHEPAYAALKGGKYEAALREYSQLAATGSTVAWISLGWMHEHAAGVPRNVGEAERCYRKAVALGDMPANFYLARLLIENKDYQTAFTYFLEAADHGHLPSIYWTGTLYLRGEGVAKDVRKAESYLKQAVDRGHVFARRDYHLALLRGTFGKRQLIKNISGWISALFAAPKVAMSDADSELLQ